MSCGDPSLHVKPDAPAKRGNSESYASGNRAQDKAELARLLLEEVMASFYAPSELGKTRGAFESRNAQHCTPPGQVGDEPWLHDSEALRGSRPSPFPLGIP